MISFVLRGTDLIKSDDLNLDFVVNAHRIMLCVMR